MKILAIFLFFAFVSVAHGEHIPHELDGTVVKELDALCIEKYERLDFVAGDLNQDGVNDLVAVYRNVSEESQEEATPEMKRLVIVLMRENDGYHVLGVNANLVYYYRYDQNFSESLVGIRTGKGFFAIDQYGGFAERWGREVVFRYDAQEGKLLFDNDSTQYFHASDSEKILRETTITAKDIGRVEWTEYSIYHDGTTQSE